MSTKRYDRRIQRTRVLLHGALASLIHEKSYDDIVVKEILARANVGRSTFYTHFHDKEDLLESSIRDVLETSRSPSSSRAASAADEIIEWTFGLFQHIERHRVTLKGPTDVRQQARVHEHLEKELVRCTTEELESRASARRQSVEMARHSLIAQFIASTFLVVLQWWFEREPSLSARQANNVLATLIQPALAGTSGAPIALNSTVPHHPEPLPT